MRPIWLYLMLSLVLITLVAAVVFVVATNEIWSVAAAPTVTPAPWPTPKPSRTPTATLGPTATATTKPVPSPTATPTPRVTLDEVTALGRLETVDYAMQVVVDIEQDPTGLWQRLFGTDRLLLIAGGEAIAGFDLTKLSENDIDVDGESVVLTLPAPEVFSMRLDNKETYVLRRDSGLLSPFDVDLEGEARIQAEEEMLAWAMRHDILTKAEENGKLYLASFLANLGFGAVEIRVHSHR